MKNADNKAQESYEGQLCCIWKHYSKLEFFDYAADRICRLAEALK